MSSFIGTRMLSRRRTVLGLGAGGLGVALAARGMGALAAQDEAATPAPVMGETYVGEAVDLDASVAVVLVAAEGDQQEARAYLCDGREVNEWFNQGTASADTLRLASENGAALDAELTAAGVTGTVTLPGGEPFAFTAAPAEGIAGLYDVAVTPDGLVRGTSAEGGRLEGLVAQAPLQEPEELRGQYPVVGFLTPPEGQPERFEATARIEATASVAGPTYARFIVLPDGSVKGGKKKGGEGEGFSTFPIG